MSRPERGASAPAKVALAVVSSVAALALVEIGLRLGDVGGPQGISPYRTGGVYGATHDLTVPDRDLVFRLRPGAEVLGYYHVNSRGWRSPEVADRPEPGVVRVVCVGDSCTFGLGVRQDRTWPAQLQRLLDGLFEGEPGFEVVNTGVPGYSTWQNRLQVENDVLALEPDVVVALPIGHNDASGSRDLTDAEVTGANRSLAGYLERLHISRLTRGRSEEEESGALGLLLPGWPAATRRVPADAFVENLRATAGMVREAGADLMLVAPPHSRAAIAQSDAYLASAAAVEDVARERSLVLADPRADFAAYGEQELFLDPTHPDEHGQGWIAAAVLESLVAMESIPLSASRRAFARAWLAARREGLEEHDVAAALDGAPAPFPAVWDAYRSDDVDERLRAGDESLPALVRRHDPLLGTERVPASPAALRLLATRSRPPDAERLRDADLAARHVVPDDPFTRLLRGATDAPPADRVLLARALEVLDCALGLPRHRVDRRLASAARHEAEGRIEEALRDLDAALHLNPADIDVLYRKGMVLRRNRQAQEAVAAFQHILDIAPDSPLGHAVLGSMSLRHGRHDEAEASLRRSIALDPAFPQARYYLGRVLMEVGQLDEARVQLETARAFGSLFTDIPQLLAEIDARREPEGDGQSNADAVNPR